MNTIETAKAKAQADEGLAAARLALAEGRIDRSAFEAAEWSAKEATIRDETARERETAERKRQHEAETAARRARCAELDSMLDSAPMTRGAEVTERLAQAVLAFEELIAKELDAYVSELEAASLEWAQLGETTGLLPEDGEAREKALARIHDQLARRPQQAENKVMFDLAMRLNDLLKERPAVESTFRLRHHARFFDLPTAPMLVAARPTSVD